jgi:DHA1 family bicyclomycin/chloramphenicol resistance-like MFS transporter
VALTWITLGPAGAQRIAHGAAKDIAPERRP